MGGNRCQLIIDYIFSTNNRRRMLSRLIWKLLASITTWMKTYIKTASLLTRDYGLWWKHIRTQIIFILRAGFNKPIALMRGVTKPSVLISLDHGPVALPITTNIAMDMEMKVQLVDTVNS